MMFSTLAVWYIFLNCPVISIFAKSVGHAETDSCQSYTDPVYTNYGALQGLVSERSRIFYGIPYAMPPVGQRRWKAPEEPLSMGENTFLSISQPPACPQVCGDPIGTCPEVFDEDCLYLNIFTPLNVKESDSLPVMIFIHGGNFDHGGAATLLYDGQHLANTTNTIMVVINYRVGALGFLVADGIDESLNGNFAILDQRLAFKYVQENIAAFGGDPNSVTLFGQSAGAQSIAIHMSSPDSANLFHRSIMQSNPFTLPYRDRASAVEIGVQLADVLGCIPSDIDCLRSCSSYDIYEAQLVVASNVDYTDLLQNFEYWGPVIDGTEIAMHPLEAYAQNSFQDKPMIIGALSQDALPYVYQLLPFEVPTALANTILFGLFGANALKISLLYPFQLFGGDQRDVLTDITTDLVFACSSRYALLNAQQNGQSAVYMYEFAHAVSFEEAWGPGMSYCYGKVCHGGDLPFIFQNAGELGYVYTTEELLLSDSMIYYWTNFAHTGDPNKVGEKSTSNYNPEFTTWPEFTVEDGMAQIRLVTPINEQLTDYKTDNCDLFDSIGYDVTYGLDIEIVNEVESSKVGNTK
ncbi:cAMP-regulated D2 protein-like [Anneissia japonica]|uniref:cAMP-regulated D2 protein-like n=1 Tax=Anneissia japonica TaxID=1529436 RepID=UPI0014255D02|nr:cAMP-regulated D2 protein-like [Anneissia japonica]